MYQYLSGRLRQLGILHGDLGEILGMSSAAVSRRFTGATSWTVDDAGLALLREFGADACADRGGAGVRDIRRRPPWRALPMTADKLRPDERTCVTGIPAPKKARWGGNPGGLEDSSAEKQSNTTADNISAFEVKNKMKYPIDIEKYTTAMRIEFGPDEDSERIHRLLIPLVNRAYQAGLDGVPGYPISFEEYAQSRDTEVERFELAQEIIGWVNRAYEQGRQDAMGGGRYDC